MAPEWRVRVTAPERRDVIWLDFEPAKGREIGKYRPALVLSSQDYNRRTGLLICCPISTSIRGGATEVPVENLDQPSVVVANLVRRRQGGIAGNRDVVSKACATERFGWKFLGGRTTYRANLLLFMG